MAAFLASHSALGEPPSVAMAYRLERRTAPPLFFSFFLPTSSPSVAASREQQRRCFVAVLRWAVRGALPSWLSVAP